MILTNNINNNRGFSLAATLVATAITGMLLTTLIQMFSFQHTELTSIKEQLAAASNHYLILQALKNTETCNCHFKDSINSSPEDGLQQTIGPFTIDTRPDQTPSDINLGSIRTGCDFTGPHNIIAAAGTAVYNRLTVQSVQVKNIRPTGTVGEFQGDLKIAYVDGSYVRAFRPPQASLLLSTSPADAVAPGRIDAPIVSCGKLVAARVDPAQQLEISMVQLKANSINMSGSDWKAGKAAVLGSGFVVARCPAGYVAWSATRRDGTALRVVANSSFKRGDTAQHM